MKRREHSNTLIKVIIAVFVLLFMVFSILSHSRSTVSKVVIRINDVKEKKQLISKRQVNGLIKTNLGYDLSMSKIKNLDLNELENFLESDERISRVEIFMNKYNTVYINVIQNLPIVRVNVSGGDDYYLDYEGNRIPVVGDIFRVPVVTGFTDDYVSNYKKLKDHNLNDILLLSRKVYEDQMLVTLVEQIFIDKNDEIVLSPKLGRERITLGSVDNIDSKIYKLKSYYKNGVKNIGIDRFDNLNLKFEGQIVGTRKTS